MNSFNQLPESFQPGDRDVVIGKGKKYFFHKGNAMLRGLAASMLNEYANAKTKLDKSLIISDVAEHVRQNGNFVKRAGERWVVAEDLLCREKISAVFRDALHQRCRPSGSSFTKRTEEKFRAMAPPKAHAPFQWKIKIPPPMFGLNAPSCEMPQLPQASLLAASNPTPQIPQMSQISQVPQMPSLLAASSAAASGTGDIFSIFSSALANIKEEGDPFEPKPIVDNSSATPPLSSSRDAPYCLSPGSRAA